MFSVVKQVHEIRDIKKLSVDFNLFSTMDM